MPTNTNKITMLCILVLMLTCTLLYAGGRGHDLRWTFGGGKRGTDGPGTGPGKYGQTINSSMNCEEIYAKVPRTGMTNGADSWFLVQKDFNDSRDHLINFKWQAMVLTKGHANADMHAIQITDGAVEEGMNVFGPTAENPPHTHNLYSVNDAPMKSPAVWSVQIRGSEDPPSARLTDENGNVIGTCTLSKSRSWHLRFVVAVGTSSGYPEKDCRLRLWWVRSIDH